MTTFVEEQMELYKYLRDPLSHHLKNYMTKQLMLFLSPPVVCKLFYSYLYINALDLIIHDYNKYSLFTGSRDAKVLVLDKNYNVITKVLLEDLLRGNPNLVSQCPEVRAICLS